MTLNNILSTLDPCNCFVIQQSTGTHLSQNHRHRKQNKLLHKLLCTKKLVMLVVLYSLCINKWLENYTPTKSNKYIALKNSLGLFLSLYFSLNVPVMQIASDQHKPFRFATTLVLYYYGSTQWVIRLRQ